MNTILDIIANHARKRVVADKERISPEAMKELAANGGPANGKAFYDAVAKPGISFLCEVKKASPSKGIIDPVFDYLTIAQDYEEAGADGISCLTEPQWFLGSDEIFREIRAAIRTPMLRKDFVVDEYQLYQAKVMGADCVLLICALLDTDTNTRYLDICSQLGLAALVEAHDAAEISSAVRAGAQMIGVNNRNLKDFSVDLGNAASLRDHIPLGTLYVAESGIQTPSDAAAMKAIGVDAVLMGEVLMRAPDKKAMLGAMRKATK